MCAIAGIFSFSGPAGPVAEADVLGLRDAMAVRGPDGAGLWLSGDGRLGLGHRRLSIIAPGPSGAQPMVSADGALCVAFNGEIYNYRDLRAGLEREGCLFRSDSDTEVLLHLYARHGRGMVRHLRGMFAFALWDGRRRGLLLARDPFGMKPLYLAEENGRLRFASQVKALAGGGGGALDPAGLTGFLLFGFIPEPHTLYRGIRSLPAGSTLWVEEDRPGRVERYFSARDILAEAEASPPPAGTDVRERLREAVLSSVRYHLVADVPVGLFLSAGIDSGVLLALATEAGGPGMDAITLSFDRDRGGPGDEAPLAARTAARFQARHHVRAIGAGDFHAGREALLAAMDQPSVDGVNTWFASAAAAALGLKVVLSGLGGDELLGGYPGFRQIPRLTAVLAPFARLPRLGVTLRRAATPFLERVTSPKYAGLLEYGSSLGGAYLLRRGLFMPWELSGLLGREMAREGWEALDLPARLTAMAAGLRRPRLQVMILEMEWYMRGQLLRDSDWAGMAHGVEIRTPLVDAGLFRALAPLLAHPPGLGKDDLPAAARPSLPAALLSRPKTGFNVPVRDWLGRERPGRRGLRDWAMEVLRVQAGTGVTRP